jgi:hypothetical protein
MTNQFKPIALLTTVLLLPLGRASADVVLTDVTVFSADAAGTYVSGDIWDTRPGASFNVWIQSGSSGGPFLTGPSDAAVRPNILISPGVNSFRLLADPGVDRSHIGVNLFFNGANLPSISVYGPLRTAPGSSSFQADGAAVTPGPDTGAAQLVPGAGTLQFQAGGQMYTLTDFFWATPSVYHVDQIGTTSTGANGIQDYVGGITLEVTPVPEPHRALWLISLLAIGATMQLRSQRRPKADLPLPQ